MSFKIVALINNEIKSFEIYYDPLVSEYLLDKIDEKYFNNDNYKENIKSILKHEDIKNITDDEINLFIDEFFIEENLYRKNISNKLSRARLLLIESRSFFKKLSYSEVDKLLIMISNVLYNMSIKEMDNLFFNLFLIFSKLPNIGDEYAGSIIKKEDVKEFLLSCEKLIKKDFTIDYKKYSNDQGLSKLIEHCIKNEIKGDMILTLDYYFETDCEDFEKVHCLKGFSKIELLKSKGFLDYLNNLEDDDFKYGDYNDIVLEYINNMNLEIDQMKIMDYYKSSIESDATRRSYIDIDECRDFEFIYIDTLKEMI